MAGDGTTLVVMYFVTHIYTCLHLLQLGIVPQFASLVACLSLLPVACVPWIGLCTAPVVSTAWPAFSRCCLRFGLRHLMKTFRRVGNCHGSALITGGNESGLNVGLEQVRNKYVLCSCWF